VTVIFTKGRRLRNTITAKLEYQQATFKE